MNQDMLVKGGGADPRSRSGADIFGLMKKPPVWCAARTGREPFMSQRQGDVPVAGAQRRFGKGPVDDIALRVAAADLRHVEASFQQPSHGQTVSAAMERREGLDHRNADRAIEPGGLEIAGGCLT